LSLNATQLEDDAAAGLACAILKTVIAEDETGARAMAAWAIHETRMKVERRGRSGWTVTWKGRGWDRPLAEYLALLRTGRDLARATGMLVVPSVKYHLPRLAEPFRDGEYRHTTRRLAGAWGEPPLLLEKDFSPTLAGDALSEDPAQIIRWLREVPERIREAAPVPVRVAVKLMNARFDDAFQVAMMDAAAGADTLVCFNRLFDDKLGVAYGGWDLSDRNLRVLDLYRLRPPATASYRPRVGTGNVCSGRVLRTEIRGNPFARAGVETAAWDLAAHRAGVGMAQLIAGRLGVAPAASVPCGVALGIPGDRQPETLTRRADDALQRGHRRGGRKAVAGWDG